MHLTFLERIRGYQAQSGWTDSTSIILLASFLEKYEKEVRCRHCFNQNKISIELEAYFEDIIAFEDSNQLDLF